MHYNECPVSQKSETRIQTYYLSFLRELIFLNGRHLRVQYINFGDMLNVVAGKSTVELCYYDYDTLYYDMLRPFTSANVCKRTRWL